MSDCYRCLYHESHRCRNEKKCPDGMEYIEYTGSSVKQCLCATTEVYQDGYIHCPILESIGCEECMERFGDGNGYEHDETQNYERKPRREEVKEVAKQTYYTKCGRKFQKNSTAVVTGYDIDINDPECADCPFQVDVKEGWPPVHKKWECRAGSEPPNHETTWRGSLDDKNTIQIDSLDHELMEEIRQFCIDHPELGAAYNADCMADCRRTLSISCSSNKKGIAAKRELVEKFFPVEEKWVIPESCADCTYQPVKGKETCNTIYADQKASGKCGWYCNVKTGEMGDLLYKEQYGEEKAEEVEEVKEDECLKIAQKEEAITNVITFDYSSVDEETGAFLQEKANRITEIRIKSVVAIGKELKEAQDKLANNKTGTFQAWAESLGLSKSSTYNYINAYNYIVQNLDNIEDAEKIQPSLLFAASKSSAPKELSDKVATGDITTHKQYKELEKRLKDAEAQAERARVLKHQADTDKIKAEIALKKVSSDSEKCINSHLKMITELNQRLDHAKRNSDPAKVQELGQIISDKQHEIETLRQQLHAKPIEVAATKIVEKEIIPDEVAEAIYCKIKYLYEGIKNLTAKEIQIFADHVDPAYYDTLTSDIDEAIVILEKISAAAYGATNMIEPEGHCGDCVNADMDAVTEEQLDEGKTLCTVTGQVVDIMDGCGKYKFFGAQS